MTRKPWCYGNSAARPLRVERLVSYSPGRTTTSLTIRAHPGGSVTGQLQAKYDTIPAAES